MYVGFVFSLMVAFYIYRIAFACQLPFRRAAFFALDMDWHSQPTYSFRSVFFQQFRSESALPLSRFILPCMVFDSILGTTTDMITDLLYAYLVRQPIFRSTPEGTLQSKYLLSILLCSFLYLSRFYKYENIYLQCTACIFHLSLITSRYSENKYGRRVS